MQDEFEVLFCDLCNTSVPLQDIERGEAVRVKGKTIGTCCLAMLRPTAGVLLPATPTVGHPPGENRMLAIGVVLLAAIAAATVYLERCFGEGSDPIKVTVDQLVKTTESHAEILRALDTEIEGTVKSEQLAILKESLRQWETAGNGERAQVNQQFERQQATLAALQQQVQEVIAGHTDYRPQFDQLQTLLQQQAIALAELKALPRSQPREGLAEEMPARPDSPPAVPGLSAALAHQVARLTDPDPATRFEAVDELLRSKNPDVRTHLLPMTKDSDTFVRRLTVEGIREFHHPDCVNALLVALADPEEIVRDTAWRSLKELTGQKLPFEANGAKESRARAQQHWQEWWEKNKSIFGS